MKRSAIVILLVLLGACGAERGTSSSRVEPAPPEPQLASLGCAAYKTYQTCNAAQGCMWAGLPLGCIKRVE
jgi:hypothetical protein